MQRWTLAGLKVGDCIAEMVYGAFSEWGIVSQKLALPVPACAPQVVALLTSGLTASIGELSPPFHLAASPLAQFFWKGSAVMAPPLISSIT